MAIWILRLAAAAATATILAFVVSYVRGCYGHLWVHDDGVAGVAVLTGTGTNGTVYYTYSVGGITYVGHSQKNWQDPRYSQAEVGDRSSVWYSASHPWLSSLPQPNLSVDAMLVPLMVGFLFFAGVCGAIAVSPHRRLMTRLQTARRSGAE